MRRAYAGFGEDGPVPAPATQPEAPSTVESRTPPYTRQALSLLGVAAIPWVPVAAGAWVGDKLVDNGKIWGALGGFTLSFLVMRHYVKKFGGVIT